MVPSIQNHPSIVSNQFLTSLYEDDDVENKMHGPCQEIEFPEVCDDLSFSAFVIDQFIKYITKRPYQA